MPRPAHFPVPHGSPGEAEPPLSLPFVLQSKDVQSRDGLEHPLQDQGTHVFCLDQFLDGCEETARNQDLANSVFRARNCE